jgi:hypothetical protein
VLGLLRKPPPAFGHQQAASLGCLLAWPPALPCAAPCRAPPPRPAYAIRPAAGASVTRAALDAGTIGLVVSEPRGAAGLRVRLSLLADGAPPRRGWSRELGLLPAAVAPEDPAWAWLRAAVPVGPRLRLRAELPGFGASEWALDGDDPLMAGPSEGEPEGEAADGPGAPGQVIGGAGQGPGEATAGAPPTPAPAAAFGAVGPWALQLPEGADGLSGPRGELRLTGALQLPLPRPPPPRVEREAGAVLGAVRALWAAPCAARARPRCQRQRRARRRRGPARCLLHLPLPPRRCSARLLRIRSSTPQ